MIDGKMYYNGCGWDFFLMLDSDHLKAITADNILSFRA